jgi:hypothetical protein
MALILEMAEAQTIVELFFTGTRRPETVLLGSAHACVFSGMIDPNVTVAAERETKNP